MAITVIIAVYNAAGEGLLSPKRLWRSLALITEVKEGKEAAPNPALPDGVAWPKGKL